MKNRTERAVHPERERPAGDRLALGIAWGSALGVALGVSIGSAIDDIVLGVGVGIPIGLGLSVFVGVLRVAHRKSGPFSPHHREED